MSTYTKRTQKTQKHTASYACMALVLPILSLILPLSLSGHASLRAISWIACALSLAVLVLLVRSFAAVAISVLAVTFSLSVTGDPTAVVIALGIPLVSGIYAASVAAAKKAHIAFVACAPLLSVALAFAMTRSLPLALLALVSFPPSLLMGLGTRRGLDRSRAIALFAVVSAIELLAGAVAYLMIRNGGIDRKIIEDAVVYIQSGIESALTEAIDTAGNVAIDEALLIEIRSLSAYTVNLLPGAVAVAMLSIGFFAHRTECALFGKYEKDSLFESSNTPITVSCTAALVFLAAHVFSYTSGPSHAPSFIAIASENLALILLPALLVVGWDKISALPRRIGFLAIAAWIGIVIAANALGESIVSILALIGAFCIILSRTDSWAKDHYRKGEDQ